MEHLLNDLEHTDMADMVNVWLLRLQQDDDLPDSVRDAASTTDAAFSDLFSAIQNMEQDQ